MVRHIFLWFLMLCLASCGFHRRGEPPLSPPLQRIYIQTSDPYGALTNNLRDYLTVAGVEVTDSPATALMILHIISETENQQLLSVSGTQQTRQYNLTLAVTFEIMNPKGVVLVPPLTLHEYRIFTTVSDQILGGTNEQDTLYQQMRLAIISDIINRLSSREVTTLLMEPKKNHETSASTTGTTR